MVKTLTQDENILRKVSAFNWKHTHVHERERDKDHSFWEANSSICIFVSIPNKDTLNFSTKKEKLSRE